MKETKIWFIFLRILTDIIAIAIVWIPFFIFEYGVDPFMRGYYCNDESIMYPYSSDTISTPVLFGVTLGVNFIGIIVIEALRGVLTTCAQSWFLHKGEPNVPCCMRIICCKTCYKKPLLMPLAIQKGYKCLMLFFIGYGITLFFTEVGKFSIGRLRPSFLSVCKPNTSACAGVVGDLTFHTGLLKYVTDPQCGAPASLAGRLRDSRLSFPSGHASLSFYGAVFFVLYLQARLPIHRLRALRLALQTVVVVGAFYCCLSRVSDYKHHPTDVIAGAVIGLVVALFTIFYGLRLFGPGPCGTRPVHRSIEQLKVSLDKVLTDASSQRILQVGDEMSKSSTAVGSGGKGAPVPLGNRSFEPSRTLLPTVSATSPQPPPLISFRGEQQTPAMG